MARRIRVAAAQMGPIARSETRPAVVKRLLALLREAHGYGCDLVAFPELALTTFFPRWPLEDEVELDAFYETEMPGPDTRPLFEEAQRLGVGFSIGYAELVREGGRKRRFNSSILVDKAGRIVGKYRKVHLPGHSEVLDRPGQHLEKRFFEVGDYGFPVWRAFGGVLGMCICNDRRWPETYRVMGLQGVEMVLLGYNSPVGLGDPYELDALEPFHNHLVMQAGAYQNATWVVGVAKAGCEEGFNQIGQTCIVAPSGEIVAQCATLGDEVIVRDCDLDLGAPYRADIFNFAYHRRPEHYRLIVERAGAVPPPESET
jgi:predicted amidohydrolase